jgi:hypothetical protein
MRACATPVAAEDGVWLVVRPAQIGALFLCINAHF